MSNPTDETSQHFLTEIAWEVCNQVGGIYTVVRSKAPVMVKNHQNNYCLMGPYSKSEAATDFDPIEEPDSMVGKAVQKCRDLGWEVHHGRWLVSGRPMAVLFNIESALPKINDIKYYYWKDHGVEFNVEDKLMDEVLAFGHMVYTFLKELNQQCRGEDKTLTAHFHEWMGGSAIPYIRKEEPSIKTVFTTHATLLGRYLAMNDPQFYHRMHQADWRAEAKHFNIEAAVGVERACASGSDVFTTVSEVTGRECKHLLGRQPDLILPNGLNIKRFTLLHEVQNYHHQYKKVLEQFIMGHFFPSYCFDLGKTLYFFSSGRFEFKNKGYDLSLEALARLNKKLKANDVDITVVMIFVTKRPVGSINSEVLHCRAMLDKIQNNCDAILQEIREKLYIHAASNSEDHRLPDLNSFVDDYWKLRYRRTLQSWQSENTPSVLTHDLADPENDEMLNSIKNLNLLNHKDDKVKVLYHPDFISSTNPLFGMEYGEFVRACHLGIFPSYYEPWGYTPLECLARGVAAVTSDLSGFGDYLKNVPVRDEEHGAYVLERANRDFESAAEKLSNLLYSFVTKTSRMRIDMRNKSEDLSEHFDWHNLYSEYRRAYEMAWRRKNARKTQTNPQ